MASLLALCVTLLSQSSAALMWSSTASPGAILDLFELKYQVGGNLISPLTEILR